MVRSISTFMLPIVCGAVGLEVCVACEIDVTIFSKFTKEMGSEDVPVVFFF